MVDASSFSLDSFLPYRLSVASNAVSQAIARIYEGRFGLRTTEWRVLAVVAGEAGGLRQSDIARRTGMDKMTISRAVGTLRDRSLVAGTTDPSDRRTPRLRATDSGRAVYDDVIPAARAVEARLVAALGPGEAERLSHTLGKLRSAAAEACAEP